MLLYSGGLYLIFIFTVYFHIFSYFLVHDQNKSQKGENEINLHKNTKILFSEGGFLRCSNSVLFFALDKE